MREQYHKRQPGRVLRPHRDWMVLDFVVGAIGAVFLGIGAWGVTIAIGHVHGDRLADLPLPRRVHDEVIAAGRAVPHHVLPDSGWVSRWTAGPKDAPGVIELFRMQYERYAARAALGSDLSR
ncbi:MAG: hypothetical protein E6J40_14430 [Chloroflexi bacterium]|nr:MAG: hypothetical protein E6J40_14430 [Chloroflexota bacterium]